MSFVDWQTADLGVSYAGLLSAVKFQGREVSPRGMKVVEARPLVLRLTDPSRCFVARPGFSRALMYAEMAMIVAGRYDQQLYADVARPETVALLTAFGAYGPRVRNQLPQVVDELTADPDSRRAMVYVGDNQDLAVVRSGRETDMPCTATWQFTVRGGRLNMLVSMRSWDLVWGLGYDLPVFVTAQRLVAHALRLPVGDYTHVAGSGHIYERHYSLEPGQRTEPLPDVVSTIEGLPDDVTGIYRLGTHVLDAKTALDVYHANMPLEAAPAQWRPAIAAWRSARDRRASGPR